MFRPIGDGGKGDAPRPINDRKKFEDNWDSIFKKKEKKSDEGRVAEVVKKTAT